MPRFFLKKYVFQIGLIVSCWYGGQSTLYAQVNLFNNPSFESVKRQTNLPNIWEECSDPFLPKPFLGPSISLNSDLKAVSGMYFLSLVKDKNQDLGNQIGQYLRLALQPNRSYQISIDLAMASHLRRQLKNGVQSSQALPCQLQIWVGKRKCSKEKILLETRPISHLDWQRYNFKFEVQESYTYLSFVLVAKGEASILAKGSLLMDRLELKEVPSLVGTLKQWNPDRIFEYIAYLSTTLPEEELPLSIRSLQRLQDLDFYFKSDDVANWMLEQDVQEIDLVIDDLMWVGSTELAEFLIEILELRTTLLEEGKSSIKKQFAQTRKAINYFIRSNYLQNDLVTFVEDNKEAILVDIRSAILASEKQ